MKVKVSAGATCYLAILNTAGHLHPRAVLDAKLPPVSNDDEFISSARTRQSSLYTTVFDQHVYCSLLKKKKKKNIYFANSKNNNNTNIMCKHRGGFPGGQTPIVLDTLSNAEYNIKY